jgi:hypothetical protein
MFDRSISWRTQIFRDRDRDRDRRAPFQHALPLLQSSTARQRVARKASLYWSKSYFVVDGSCAQRKSSFLEGHYDDDSMSLRYAEVRVVIHSQHVGVVSSWPTLNTVDSMYSMEE